MARRLKSRKRKRAARKPGWWSSIDPDRRRKVLRGVGVCLFTMAAAGTTAVGMRRLDAHVHDMVTSRAAPAVVFVDLPDQLKPVAEEDLRLVLTDVERRDWTDAALCRDMATRLATVGWVDRVHHVRRRADGRFQVSCRYRLPAAMVQQKGRFYLVDHRGMRLPGTYRFDPAWLLVQGVTIPAPAATVMWESEALRAGLAILAELEEEPFRDQIAGVVVENYGGRVDPRGSHIELATDRMGGRIRWGSAPGFELEENLTDQKLAILRENFSRSGRLDEHHPVIDISTFSDRYTVPG